MVTRSVGIQAPCAVERDSLSGQGSNLSPGAFAYQKALFHIIPMHMINREIISGIKKEASTVSSINCDRCWHLDLAVSGCWPHWRGWRKQTWLATGWSNTQHQSDLSQAVGHVYRGRALEIPNKLLTPT